MPGAFDLDSGVDFGRGILPKMTERCQQTDSLARGQFLIHPSWSNDMMAIHSGRMIASIFE